jgi:pimeloyl-ACP methyl ester carboxylesterase
MSPVRISPSYRRISLNSLVSLLVVAVVAGCAPRSTLPSAPAATPTPAAQAQLVDVGGHKLWIECAGSGHPTVILESGLGVYSGTWHRVMLQVAAFTRVCRFDRAGLGLSEPGPKPRTSERMTQELHALLSGAHMAPPYVLVGHSLAGLNVHLYASTYPDEVAGLVLVDAIHPDLDERIEELLTTAQVAERRDELELNQEGIKFADIRSSEDQLHAAGAIPDVPLVVVRHGLPFEASPDWPSDKVEQLWSELQAELATLTTHGKVIVAEHSHHRIQESEPEVVTAAIKEVVEAARK